MNIAAPSLAIRVDKWLWHARFFKTRGLAQKACASGHIRVNQRRVRKSHQTVTPGDVITFPRGNQVHVVRVRALAERRGPASEARTLYEEIAPE